MHFLTDFFFFLVPLGALGGVVFLEVSDNPHLSLRCPHLCLKLLFFWSNCQMCPLKQLFAPTMIAVVVRLWNLWPPFALGPGFHGRSSLL